MGRNSRQSPKSAVLWQPAVRDAFELAAMPNNFRAQATRKLGRRADLPVSYQGGESSTVNPAAAAASSAEAFAAVRALQIMSPRWSSRFMTQIINECEVAAQLRSNRSVEVSRSPPNLPRSSSRSRPELDCSLYARC